MDDGSSQCEIQSVRMASEVGPVPDECEKMQLEEIETSERGRQESGDNNDEANNQRDSNSPKAEEMYDAEKESDFDTEAETSCFKIDKVYTMTDEQDDLEICDNDKDEKDDKGEATNGALDIKTEAVSAAKPEVQEMKVKDEKPIKPKATRTALTKMPSLAGVGGVRVLGGGVRGPNMPLIVSMGAGNPAIPLLPAGLPPGRYMYTRERGRRKSYTAGEKLAMIEAVEAGQRKSAVADRFGVAPSTLACILAQKHKIRAEQCLKRLRNSVPTSPVVRIRYKEELSVRLHKHYFSTEQHQQNRHAAPGGYGDGGGGAGARSVPVLFGRDDFSVRSTPISRASRLRLRALQAAGARSPRNFFFSPYSIWTAFTSYFGAGGETAAQLQRALRVDDKVATLRLWRALEAMYRTRQQNTTLLFKIANRAYIDKSLPIRDCITNLFSEVERSIL
ncbi:serine proteinase inhibitor [Penaeus vannamei]|uniref:Serine proteinase inhibitor n=1 Tax=Penaeus vannamei TaxID=6689 RepID=A0A423TNE8_PENVA|nr:serine proteinase inhibitor [Penaeus vannamei]